MAAPRKTTPVKTASASAKEVLDTLGGVPDAPAVDDGDQEQETTQTNDPSDVLSIEDVELATLRAQLAEANALLSERKEARPVPEAELTPEQRQIRDLQDQLARTKGRDDSVEEHFDVGAEGITVHFVAEGLTSNNRTFYTGQEVVFGPEAYADTIDRFGNSWLNMTENEQYERWGEVKFRKGPWPGVRHYAEPEAAQKSIVTRAPAINL